MKRKHSSINAPKTLPLANSHEVTTVDYDDYQWAKHHTWFLHTDGHVVRYFDEDRRRGPIYLCNEIMSRATGRPLLTFGPPQS
jgi:hypothetical protein